MRLVRAVFASAWMGWQREMEWANPVLCLIIKTVAPIAAVLTAAAVYWFGSSFAGLFTPERLAYIVVGASLYAQVGAYAYVPTSAIAEGNGRIFIRRYSLLHPLQYRILREDVSPRSLIPRL